MTSGTDLNRFNEADKIIHLVEDQWHYPIMTKYGYVANTPSGQGFVRSYIYEHPDSGHKMTLTTGYSSDYWVDADTNAHGFWLGLDSHLESKVKK